jgi:hypothetical protein
MAGLELALGHIMGWSASGRALRVIHRREI